MDLNVIFVISVCQVLVFPASLSSAKVYRHCLVEYTEMVHNFYDKSNNLWV